LIRSLGTTITGREDKHEVELKHELETLGKKIKIRDFKLDVGISNEPSERKKYVKMRSKSALAGHHHKNKVKSLIQRSKSADSVSKINFNDLLLKNSTMSKSNSSLESNKSILKSPKTRKEMMMRKKV
jgi:hypothetical protein